MQFRAQYYNDPSDPENQPLQYSQFQYFDKKFLKLEGGNWYFRGSKLNLVAAVDFAYSLSKRADYTAIVVVGVDSDNNFYVLDIDRFQTDGRASVYFEHILDLYNKWSFRKIRAEATAAQAAIIRTLKEDYVIPYGLALKVEEVKPTRH